MTQVDYMSYNNKIANFKMHESIYPWVCINDIHKAIMYNSDNITRNMKYLVLFEDNTFYPDELLEYINNLL